MRRNHETIITLLWISTLLLSGCTSEQKPAQMAVAPHLAEMQRNSAIAKRFQETSSQAPSAVESAIELSERYAQLTEDAAALRQQNEDLMTKNQQLDRQIAELDAQLNQAQKELKEANHLLIEMRIELNSWKGNILGFREEMREAQTTQLEALFQILQLLGGQVTMETASSENIDTTALSLNQPDQP